MASFKLFCILFLGVVASSLAASVNSEDNELVTAEIIDGSSESESNESDDKERGLVTDSEGNQRCTCDNVSCKCCVAPKIPKVGKISTCLKVIIQANQKAVALELSASSKSLITKQFQVGARESMCASFPGSMHSLKGCIDTDTSNLPNNAGLQTCPRIELKTVGKTVATVIFSCVQLANRKVSLNDRGEVKAKDKFKIKLF